MRVVIGGKVYDSDINPLMIVMSDFEKKLIREMDKDNYKLCCFPDTSNWTEGAMDKWLYEGIDLLEDDGET